MKVSFALRRAALRRQRQPLLLNLQPHLHLRRRRNLIALTARLVLQPHLHLRRRHNLIVVTARLVAQSGRCPPNASSLGGFVVEGEQRYWVHPPWVTAATYGAAGIALGRDLNADGSVDVLGTQLEEVTE